MNTKIRKIGLLGTLAFVLVAAVLALSLGTGGTVVGYAATEITADDFVKTFTAKNGTITPETEGVTYTLGGENTYAELSTANFSKGSILYNEYVELRNTLVLHLKNDTSATRAKLWIKTKAKDYNENSTVDFDLYADGEFHTYYVNVTENPQIKGELKGLRIAPEAVSGSMHIKHAYFEREKARYDYAGEVTSCTSDGLKVTVTGTVKTDATKIKLYRTDISNMAESVKGLLPYRTVDVQNGKFTVEFPHHNGTTSMLSSTFIVTADDVKVGPMFKITNWRDFAENPYEFKLADRVVDVTDAKYGAKGDAYTDDTAAIQAAIDEVSSLGGGTVVLPGDDTEYGRRYIASSVWLKDNVELRIEKGAMLWQTFRDSDYHYPNGETPRKGHNYPYQDLGIDHEVWAANALIVNYPLIYGGGVKNIKITGGGAVRLYDGGNDAIKAYSGGYSSTCGGTIHLIPIGLYDCENIEVTDIDILRTNCYNMLVYKCKNVYLGNLTLTDANCLSGDGISLGLGTKNVVIERCMLHTNDDAVVLVSHSIAEPRGRSWWQANPLGGDNRLRNITVRGSAITPGNAFVFITWGNDNNDLTLQAISEIYAYDNLIGSTNKSMVVNVWDRQGYPYGDYSNPAAPVYDVHMHDNEYVGEVAHHMDGLNTKHGIVTDCGHMENTHELIDTGFGYNLAFWQYAGEYKEDVKSEGSSAVIKGKGNGIWQAPELYAGAYSLTANVKTLGATAKLFARDALSGKVIAEKAVEADNDSEVALEFTLPVRTVVRLGVECTSESGTVYFSAPSVTRVSTIDGYYTEDFEGDANFLRAYGFDLIETGGNRALGMSDTGYASLEMREPFSDYELTFDFYVDENDSKKALGGSIFVEVRRTYEGSYIARYDAYERKISIEKYDWATNTIRPLAAYRLNLLDKCWYQFGVHVHEGTVTAYIDGTIVVGATEMEPFQSGYTVIRAVGMKVRVDNVTFGELLEFGHSEHWKPGQGVDPDGKVNRNKKGCKGSLDAGSLGVLGAVLVLGAVVTLVGKKKFASRA